jgi:hypothetical protein
MVFVLIEPPEFARLLPKHRTDWNSEKIETIGTTGTIGTIGTTCLAASPDRMFAKPVDEKIAQRTNFSRCNAHFKRMKQCPSVKLSNDAFYAMLSWPNREVARVPPESLSQGSFWSL